MDDQGELFDSDLPKQEGLELNSGGETKSPEPEAVGQPLDVQQTFK